MHPDPALWTGGGIYSSLPNETSVTLATRVFNFVLTLGIFTTGGTIFFSNGKKWKQESRAVARKPRGSCSFLSTV